MADNKYEWIDGKLVTRNSLEINACPEDPMEALQCDSCQ